MGYNVGWTTATMASLSELELARAEEGSGRDGEALRHYREFLRRYDLPVQAHRPPVDEAREAVERLAPQAAGVP